MMESNMSDWIKISTEQVYGITLSAAVVYILLMIFIKINGLRSLAKMSAHDFAVTIAIGSLLAATVVNKEPSIGQGLLAIGIFILLQAMYSFWRLKRSKPLLENEPLLLMKNGKILTENLISAQITQQDLIAKLREANVLQLSEVQAVVFEATGDVSVLHGAKKLDKKLLEGVLVE